MALSYLFDPNTQFQNKNGVNNVGGYLYVFINDSDDHAPTYCNFTGTLNPERIVLDNNGRAVVIVDELKTYRIEVYDRSGNMLWSQYPVRPTNVIYGDYNVYNADIYGTLDEIDVDVETSASGVKKFTIKLANAVKTVIGNIQSTISSIVETISTKKDKQQPYSVSGNATKTVKSVSQNANGDVSVEFENIEFPQQEQADWNQADSSAVDYIKNKPNLELKADKVQGATAGNLAALDASGNIADSGKTVADFATSAQGEKADTALQAHQAVSDNNPTLAWGTTSTVGTVGSTGLRVTMPSNPASGKQQNRLIIPGTNSDKFVKLFRSYKFTDYSSIGTTVELIGNAGGTAVRVVINIKGSITADYIQFYDYDGNTTLYFTLYAVQDPDNSSRNLVYASVNANGSLYVNTADTSAGDSDIDFSVFGEEMSGRISGDTAITIRNMQDASWINSGTFGTDRIADDAITANKVKDNETLPVNVSGSAGSASVLSVKRVLSSSDNIDELENNEDFVYYHWSQDSIPSGTLPETITTYGYLLCEGHSNRKRQVMCISGNTQKIYTRQCYARQNSSFIWTPWLALATVPAGGAGYTTIPVYVDSGGQVQPCTPSSMTVGHASALTPGGNAGQVLISAGSGSDPVWGDIASAQTKHSDTITSGAGVVYYNSPADTFAIAINYDQANSKAYLTVNNVTSGRQIYVSLRHSGNLTPVPYGDNVIIASTLSEYNLIDLDILCMGIGDNLPVFSFTIAIHVNESKCTYTIYDRMLYSL